MLNISKLANTIKKLPMMEGVAGHLKFGTKQIEQMASKQNEFAKIAQEILKETKNPTLEVAYKAQSNYSIAGLKLKDGKKVISQGAISITNPASNQAVVKYRASEKGLRANGFIDGGKVADTRDMAVSMSRKAGTLKYDMQVGDATAHHVEVNEDQLVDGAKKLGMDKFLGKYANFTKNLQQTADAAMVDVRKVLRGEGKDFIWGKLEPVKEGRIVDAGFKNVKDYNGICRAETFEKSKILDSKSARIGEKRAEELRKIQEELKMKCAEVYAKKEFAKLANMTDAEYQQHIQNIIKSYS